MSRMLVIAWVARYITDRFSSRSRKPARSGVGGLQHARAFIRRDALQDRRAVVGARLGEEIDAACQVAAAAAGRLLKEHDRLPELDAVARAQEGRVDRLRVHIGPIGRSQIDNTKPIPLLPELGMPAGNLGVVEPDCVRAVTAQADGPGHELEPLTLVGPLDHEQGGHEALSPRLKCNVANVIVFGLQANAPVSERQPL